jgi:hypothetical protein
MGLFQTFFGSSEVKAAYGVLAEANHRFESEVFSLIKEEIETALRKNPSDIIDAARRGITPRQVVYTAIVNIAGDHLESGQYHIYRGVLNPTGFGPTLKRIYNTSLDELATMNAITKESAEEQKEIMRKNIRSNG